MKVDTKALQGDISRQTLDGNRFSKEQAFTNKRNNEVSWRMWRSGQSTVLNKMFVVTSAVSSTCVKTSSLSISSNTTLTVSTVYIHNQIGVIFLTPFNYTSLITSYLVNYMLCVFCVAGVNI